ncbi:hypothetical protein B0O80DRAFT_501172 [Mortierella sp. GBAus27b]|nr:hypothetical protein BGX31_005528 [Mortierella sp. GBA43]KAI8349854.1 hypothetical protein B0O80DRAFT_501172 [Mortierella sp. GBAus27b]
MSNHPENLDIRDSTGPPSAMVPLVGSESSETEEGSAIISAMQDISTFGIAGRIWDSSYVLDGYLRRPTDQYSFLPPCPIPSKHFIPPSMPTDTLSTPRSHGTTSLESEATTASTRSSDLSGKTEVGDGVSNPSESLTRPVRILEIGAGTGYVGIALAKRLQPNCTLILTDLEEVVPLMQKNVLQHLPDNNDDDTTDSTTLDPSDLSTAAASCPVSPPPPPGQTTATATISPSTTRTRTRRQCAQVLVEPLEWGNSEHAAKILAAGKIEYIVASDLVYFPELYPPLLATLREITVAGETKVFFGYKERAPWKETPFWEQFGRYFEIEVVRIQQHKDRNVDNGQDQDRDQNQEEEEEEEEDPVSVFGWEGEDRMYVFVCTKRRDEDILEGVDDTLATLAMMEMGY